MEDVVAAVGELVTSGTVRAWGIVNWPPERIAAAGRAAAALGVPAPCAAQLVYNLVSRSVVEDPAMVDALRSCGASVVASWSLAGGVLSGKYRTAGATGRYAGDLDNPRVVPAVRAAERLRGLAGEAGTTPAALAIAFALLRSDVATVLFGATRPDHVTENVRGVELLGSLGEAQLAELQRIGADGE